ncbi:MAG TPA: TolC family protein [Bacteroidia bacterium]|nr:TolC family protein [Bacteroidia bacterium]
MKKINNIVLLLMIGTKLYAQSNAALSIDSCYTMAKRNYPLLKQMALIEKTKEYSLDNASKGYLPQLNIAGQATYQSDVTAIPISLPGMNIQSLNKDQYKIYAELSQSVTDPFTIKQQKAIIEANNSTEIEKIEVELYKLKERINQLYFGILMIETQWQQVNLLKKDIELNLQKTNAAIANGISLKSNADILQAEIFKIEQRIIELKASRKAYLEMLSLFINKPIDEQTILKIPIYSMASSSINRPELKLFELQKKGIDAQQKLLASKNLPKVSLFVQGGYGRPTLNMLNNDFGTYYIGGARFIWNLSAFYTYQKERQLLTINQHQIDIQKEVFLFNNQLLLKQQNSEVNKLSELLNNDQQIVALREKIKDTANSQLENGSITAIDYLNALNAMDQAKQNLALHQIQLLLAQYTFQNTSGN